MFPARIVREATKVRQRCLDYWEEVGLIAATGTDRKKGEERKKKRSKSARSEKKEPNQKGRGDQRIYRYEDVLKITLIKQLRQAGLSLQKIRKAVRKLGNRLPKVDALREVLVTDGIKLERVRADGKVEDILANGQLVFAVVALARMDRELRGTIKRLTGQKVEIGKRQQQRKTRVRWVRA